MDWEKDEIGWGEELDWLKEPAEEEAPAPAEAVNEAPPSSEDWEQARTQMEIDYDGDGEPDEPERRRGGMAGLIVLIVLLIAGMAFAGYKLGGIFMNYHRDRSAYSELASTVIEELPDSAPAGNAARPAAQEEDAPVTEIRVSQVPITVDWEYLRSVNSDVVGWIYCPGTIINYPVVQSADNEFYLKHGFDKQSNVSGAIFADTSSVIGTASSNLVIYGHNMKDKSMFGSFQGYVNESYCDENPTMYLLTPDGAYRIDLFGAHIKPGTVDNFPTHFQSEEAYRSYIDSVSGSFFWIRPDVIIIGAAAGITDARLLIQGVMVPIE